MRRSQILFGLMSLFAGIALCLAPVAQSATTATTLCVAPVAPPTTTGTAPVVTPLAYPGALSTLALGINNTGEIVGYYGTGSGVTNGFSLQGTTYSPPIIVSKSTLTLPQGVGANGQIVGYYMDKAFNLHGFLLMPGGTPTNVDFPGATGGTFPSGINSLGTIVGYYADGTGTHGFLRTQGTFTSFDVPTTFGAAPGSTSAYGINTQGQIVGTYTDTVKGGTHGFLLSGSTYTHIDPPSTLTPTPTDGSGGFAVNNVALGINNLGQIVGYYTDMAGNIDGFLRQPDGTFSVVGPSSQFTGVNAINDSGQVVGWYGDTGFSGVFRGFLTSVPLPPTTPGPVPPGTGEDNDRDDHKDKADCDNHKAKGDCDDHKAKGDCDDHKVKGDSDDHKHKGDNDTHKDAENHGDKD